MGCSAHSCGHCSPNNVVADGVMISRSNWEHFLGTGRQPPFGSCGTEQPRLKLQPGMIRLYFPAERDRQIPGDGRWQTKLREVLQTHSRSRQKEFSLCPRLQSGCV